MLLQPGCSAIPAAGTKPRLIALLMEDLRVKQMQCLLLFVMRVLRRWCDRSRLDLKVRIRC